MKKDLVAVISQNESSSSKGSFAQDDHSRILIVCENGYERCGLFATLLIAIDKIDRNGYVSLIIMIYFNL